MTESLTIAFALVLVIEGLAYALFPDQLRKLMAMALQLPTEQLRMMGLLAAGSGVFFIWLVQNFT